MSEGERVVRSVVRALVHGLIAGSVSLAVADGLAAQGVEGPSYSLEQAIAIALENNRELQDAQIGLETADHQVREAWGNAFPSVDATLSYQRNLEVQEAFLPAIIFDPAADPNEVIPVRFGADNNWSAWVNVTQPLFDASVFVGVGAAGRFQAVQEESVRGQAQRVATRVRRAYYTALAAHELVRVTQESINRTEQTLKETRGLNRAGLAANYDVLRLEVRLANLTPNLRRAANQAAAAERGLSVEMGLEEVTPVRVVGQLHQIDLATIEANEGANRDLLRLVGYDDALSASFEELFALAKGRRSDLRQARLNVELEDARVRYERTNLYPRLSAFFSYGIIAQENGALNFFGQNQNQRTTSAFIGVQLEVPIFSGFQRSSRVQQRQLGRRQAEVRLELLEQQAANEIRTALEALEEARRRAEAQRTAVSEARRGFEIVTSQYLAGLSSQLDVTEGEVLLRESEYNYAQAVFDYLMAQADLDDAIGVVPLVDATRQGAERSSISE
ncbi:MAG: TolC family protein [Gemmatimonadota bacterium]|nr:MAG: TolC family protein [Gemmatimonadota bacterium]